MKFIYRPEIDGLRAVAVFAVILYHAQITIESYQPFKGGFIGVDIFFVISGYLITSIILKELSKTGEFSFKYFYQRRIRRILPVLLTVMLASLPFAWFYLLPNSFMDFSKSILYSLGFSSNFYFHYSGQQYGAESGLLKPFLHTWSLSVEEQYYILFPVILLIIFKYFRKFLFQFLIIGFFISLLLADWGSRNHPSFNFYVLPTRGWELLAGSFISYFEFKLGRRGKNSALNHLMPVLGLILIMQSIIFFDDKMFHPSLYTLSPIIGVSLIIWFSSREEIITRILSSKSFVSIGLVSYSLYLWHFPIFAFARVKYTSLSNFDKIECVILALILSFLSYFFIEKPARDAKIKFKTIFLIIIISAALLVTILHFQKKENLKYVIKSGNYGVDFNANQLIGKGQRQLVIFGDSHATHIMAYLKEISLDKNLSFYNVTHPACISLPTITNFYTLNENKAFHLRETCTYLYKNISEIIKSSSTEPLVVFYNTWFKHIIKNNSKIYNEDLKFNDDPVHNKKVMKIILDDIVELKRMSKANRKWILVGKNPGSYNYKFKGFLNCYNSNKSYLRQPYHEVDGCEKKGLKENGISYLNHKLFKETISSNYKNDFIYLDSYQLYCDDIHCNNFTKNNKLIYTDHHHFTFEGSKKIVQKILEYL